MLVILTFVPVPFVHPLRVGRYRKTGLALVAVGAVLAVIAMLRDMAPGGLGDRGLMRDRALFPRRRVAATGGVDVNS
jgi:hypothetical protein